MTLTDVAAKTEAPAATTEDLSVTTEAYSAKTEGPSAKWRGPRQRLRGNSGGPFDWVDAAFIANCVAAVSSIRKSGIEAIGALPSKLQQHCLEPATVLPGPTAAASRSSGSSMGDRRCQDRTRS